MTTSSNSLADLYAAAKAEADRISKTLEKLRAEILATGVEEIVGNHAIVVVSLSERTSFDSKTAKAYLTADQIADCSKVALVETLRIKPNLN
jgi:hypothetical protein